MCVYVVFASLEFAASITAYLLIFVCMRMFGLFMYTLHLNL